MRAMKPKNPFIVSGYHSPEYFCDREKETAALVSAIHNDRNVTLVAPRRMGKSGLIKNAFYHLGKEGEYKCAYVDVFGTQCLAEFVRAFASGVLSAFETSFDRVVRSASSFLKGFRPTVTVDAFGSQTYSFDVTEASAESTLSGVFDYLESRKFRTVVALDEFQQIAHYPERGVEAMLRSRIQFLTGHQFVFAGSRQHMMSEMFVSAKRPFYHSTQMMPIGPINCGTYCDFAARHFAKAGIKLDRDVFNGVYERFGGVTWYVQAVMNRLYESGAKRPTDDDVTDAIRNLVDGNAYEYETILDGCTEGAARLLKAIAAEGCVAEITGGRFISRHGLKAASSVKAALRSLLAADLVYRTDAGYIVYDRLFGLWLSRLSA